VRGGIDLGGTKIQAVVVDDASEVHGRARVPTPTEGAPRPDEVRP
jgi:glucokinase